MDIKSWLQTVLLQYYNDPDRTFRDVDAVLQMHITSLKPKMDTYTYNDGHTQLLLCLHGTVPITYRSIPYNIPVAFWIPTEYPQYPPIPYVKPTANMLVREGKHVDKSGLCYHPYRSNWKEDVNNHTLLELIAILQHIFGNEPPVYTKAVTSSPSSNVGSPIKENGISTMSPGLTHATMHHPTPPPPPPPPIPQSQSPIQSSAMVDGPVQQQLRWPGEGTAYYNLNQDMSGLTLNSNSYGPTPINSTSNSHLTKSSSLPTIASTYPQQPQQQQQQQQQPQQQQPQQASSLWRHGTPLMDNKENDLQNRLYRKVAERMQAFHMDISSDMDDLLNVNRQLNDGEIQLQNEQQVLQDLRTRFQKNIDILQSRTKDIDKIIDDVNAMPDVSVDEALSGTTVVYNQLFDLVADDHAIMDTIYYLGKALTTECIDLPTFMKCTRKLAREQFMKRALVKKITDA
ncbi:UEV domain-domain-containing protein [Absidia repens]|uniref:UEV domain-domain-containing protein n=1 Tax=Absidia repens TaxID=90262 RepID=A0A1X2IB77_9FUNG|nr:UEV domain-domain-containing protein [Absidia repens]